MVYPPSPPSSSSSTSPPSISFDHYVHYAGKAAELAREAILQLPSLQHRLKELESELQVVSGADLSLSFLSLDSQLIYSGIDSGSWVIQKLVKEPKMLKNN